MKGWEKISKKVDYQCPYFKIVKEDFIMPSGKKSSYYGIKESDGVIVIPKDGEYIYMEEIYRPFIKAISLEFPGGILDKKETLSEAAEREIKEELGISARKITFLGKYCVWVARTDMKVWIFLAENISFGNKKRLDKEEKESKIKIKKIKISNIVKLIKNGRIKSAHHILAYFIFVNKYYL